MSFTNRSFDYRWSVGWVIFKTRLLIIFIHTTNGLFVRLALKSNTARSF